MTLMDLEHLAAWMALAETPGIGAVLGNRLVQRFGSPERVLAADLLQLRQVEGIHLRLAEAVRASSDYGGRVAEIKALAEQGIALLVRDDPGYPARLRHIADPPLVLYQKGAWTATNDAVPVAVVGCRNPDPYGEAMAKKIGAGLAQAGATVVSGLARGVDSIAQRAALDAGGRTVAVLGAGVDVVYPPEHEDLYRDVIAAGAVLSPFPPGSEPQPGQFPARNRIISGLALGVVVVQAMSEKSGSLITARLALEQGREVYAVPGAASSRGGRITNRLIKDGARLIEEAEDILADLRPQTPGLKTIAAGAVREFPARGLSSAEEKLFSLLPELGEGSVHLDALAAKTALSAAEVSRSLLALELSGVVKKLPGNYYVKAD